MSLFVELKRRNVFRVGIAYAVAAWLILQLTEVLSDLLDLQSDIGKIVIILLVAGFPIVLFFAWAFELTPEGIKREKDVDRSQSISPQTGRKLDRAIIALLVLIAGYFIWESRFASSPAPGTVDQSVAQVRPVSSPPMPTPMGTEGESQPLFARSIAVLPFANRSMQAEDLFFTDGIHDDLLTQLAKIEDLKVISRTSVMKYRDTEKTIPEIAAELGVVTILEGGIQRAGNRVRINAQLIDVEHDNHLWAETFDREMTLENIFDIQSEITKQIVGAVRGEISDEESASLARVPTDSLEAYEAYLKGRAWLNRADYSQDNYIQAQFWLEQALALDPEYGQAWALMVEVHGQALWIGFDATPERVIAARLAMESAQRFAPGTAESRGAEGEFLYRVENDFAAAVQRFQQAHELAPGDSNLLERLAVAQRRAGMLDESLVNFRGAMELDPGNSRTVTLLADTQIMIKRYDEIANEIDTWLTRFPEARDLRGLKARNLMHGFGDLEGAQEIMDGLPPWSANEYYVVTTELPLLKRDFEGVIRAWRQPVVRELLQNRGYVGGDGFRVGLAYRMLGDEARALETFQATIDQFQSLPKTGTQVDGFELESLALSYAGAGRFTEALEAIDDSVALMREAGDAIFTADMEAARALILGMAGRHDEALAEIERLLPGPAAYMNRWDLRLNPKWDFFRDDERFNELLESEGVE